MIFYTVKTYNPIRDKLAGQPSPNCWYRGPSLDNATRMYHTMYERLARGCTLILSDGERVLKKYTNIGD